MEEKDIAKGIELLEQVAELFKNHMPVYTRCKEAIWHAKQTNVLLSPENGNEEIRSTKIGFQQSL